MKLLETLSTELATVDLTDTTHHPEEEPCECCKPLGTLSEEGQRIYALLAKVINEHNALAERYNASEDTAERTELTPQLEMLRLKHTILGAMFSKALLDQFPENIGEQLRIRKGWKVLPAATIQGFMLFGGGFGPDISVGFGSRRGH